DSEIFETSNPIKINDFNKTIEFKNVNFSYDEGKQILSNINFIINKGEKVAFVGASGSGKTTIANLINRMYDVTEGEILIDNIPIKSIKIDKLRTLFGIVTQDSILFSDTIENNINYGSHKPINLEDIKKACQFAYASEFIEQLPEQYNTRILPHGSNLSGGQRQRLCIARAIVNNPPILIFDEATSALDTDSEQKVQKAIDMAADNRTVIMIAHRLSTILTSDKIFVLEKGKIVGAGKHNELLQTCQQYEHFFNLQFKGK
ncbi:MAG: ATP-binding cassette domain-containing protein, partial [Candidatus Cloacimonetes bacterium]|nr:ATP-binding cassette domain-containing protein [Candidatus Cloacimonadota bacterium]